jgi:hypothetical protein
LIRLGWYEHQAERSFGLSSPNDATFVDEDAVSDTQIRTFVDAVAKRVSSMRAREEAADNDRSARILDDFEQLLAALNAVWPR